MTFDITQIVVALIGLLAAVITTVAIPWIRTKLGAQRWEQLQSIALVAVQAAEQLYKAGQGEAKLKYALERTREAMRKMGVSYDEGTIRAAIEAAVLELNTI